ncbi:hypothetical protein [Tissierella praeacuta]|uniref:hypothetical protein n=1 Tax=Tissierella praeacuta TaxID=43131 RepID=UPI003340D2EB
MSKLLTQVQAESIPKEYAFTSFVLILERYLRFLVNEIEGKSEKNNELQFNFHVDFVYAKNMTTVEKYMNMYEHIVLKNIG